MTDDILGTFGIGLIEDLEDKSTDELFQILNKTRSKIFNKEGKVIRQTLSKEEKALKRLQKIAMDESIPLEERIKALKALQEGAKK